MIVHLLGFVIRAQYAFVMLCGIVCIYICKETLYRIRDFAVRISKEDIMNGEPYEIFNQKYHKDKKRRIKNLIKMKNRITRDRERSVS